MCIFPGVYIYICIHITIIYLTSNGPQPLKLCRAPRLSKLGAVPGIEAKLAGSVASMTERLT